MRAGTENVPAIVGMGRAATLAMESLEERIMRETKLRNYMIHRIEQEIPYCHLNGPRNHRLPNNVNMSFAFVEGETIVIMLDMEGICASAGSACTAGQSVASHVIDALGLSADITRGTLRFTLGKETTREEIDQTVDALKKVLDKSRTLNPSYIAFIKRNRKR